MKKTIAHKTIRRSAQLNPRLRDEPASRGASHPRVRAVMAAFDRIASSDARATNDIPDGDNLINTCFGMLFNSFDVCGWTDGAVRNVLLALVTNCPTSDLEIFEEWTARQIEFVQEFEVALRYSSIAGKDLPHEVDQGALRRAFAGESKPAVVAETVEAAEVY